MMTDLVFKLFSLILLTPLIASLFRFLLAMAGNSFLTDQDIALFFLTPIGFPIVMLAGALNLAILMLGMTSLLAVLASRDGSPTSPLVAIRIAILRFASITSLTARVIGWLLLTLLPFSAAIAVLYFVLLGEHDINFYLHHWPTEFRWAVGLALLIALMGLLVCLRLILDWVFALPIVVFEELSASQALQASRQRVAGRRLSSLLLLIGWFSLMAVVSFLTTTLIVFITQWFVSEESASLVKLTTIIGISVIAWSLANLAISVLGSTTLAALYFSLYRFWGTAPDSTTEDLILSPPADASGWVITKQQLTGLLLVGMVASFFLGSVMVRSVHVEDEVAIIAHRGASFAAPENTMAAVSRAIEDGADWVEIDVQETADGQVVVFHDKDFMRMAGQSLKIHEATLEDVANIDIGSWFDGKFRDQRVPTLEMVLDECQGKAGLFIELKYYGYEQRLEERVAQIIDSRKMADQIVVMSLKREGVEKMKSLRPGWKVGLLMSVSTGNLSSVDVEFFAVNAGFANAAFVNSAQAADKEVHVWTVNDSITMSKLISRGVNGIITDRPDLLRDVLRVRASMTVPQRLLLELADLFGNTPEIVEQ